MEVNNSGINKWGIWVIRVVVTLMIAAVINHFSEAIQNIQAGVNRNNVDSKVAIGKLELVLKRIDRVAAKADKNGETVGKLSQKIALMDQALRFRVKNDNRLEKPDSLAGRKPDSGYVYD